MIFVLVGLSESSLCMSLVFMFVLVHAEVNMGEQEVRDGLLATAEFLAGIGDRVAADAAFEATEAKTAGVGNKMDLCLSQTRWDWLVDTA